ncbi:MAG: DUF6754 domain-containing protein [bacterium]|nr:DUF6754 domain-containing protein [bacterium]
MDATTRVVTTLILVIALIGVTIFTQFARRRRAAFPLRAIPAYQAIPLLVGEAIESARPVHVSFGGVGIGGLSTALALASAEVVYQTARRAAIGVDAPIITGSDPTFLPLAYATLYRAYGSRGRADRAPSTAVRWYPSLQRTGGLAFAAALTGTIGSEQVSGNILLGSYGAELALILDTASRGGRRSVAGSDQLIGQAVAYGMATSPLIGEEMFVGGAYLGDEAGTLAVATTIDLLRWLLIGGLAGSIGFVVAARLLGAA